MNNRCCFVSFSYLSSSERKYRQCRCAWPKTCCANISIHFLRQLFCHVCVRTCFRCLSLQFTLDLINTMPLNCENAGDFVDSINKWPQIPADLHNQMHGKKWAMALSNFNRKFPFVPTRWNAGVGQVSWDPFSTTPFKYLSPGNRDS